ncbi:hypothetical protein CRG98_036004 [Punica granatum]|uniref:Uncharacterized protein n=1 Tax=Punica granatum TaxID=22663 RepID=A0A2I0IHV6_PUNGR|nr:hypothetical protein CRG98_036004 [Punica granatum]
MLRKFAESARRASYNRTKSAHPCEFSFMLRKFTEPGLSCFLQPYRVCSPMRVFFHALQVRRACSLVLLATLPGQLTCASFLSCFASSLSLLARASCNLPGSAHPCEFSFMLRKFTEPGLSCFLQPYRVCSPMRVFFHASQVHRAWSLVLLATLPGLLTHASFLSCFASSPSLVSRASCNLTGSAHPCEFSFMLRKFTEPGLSCFLQPYRVCSPMRVFFHASQVHRAWSLVLLATLPGLLTHASFLSCFASSPSLVSRASCNLTGSAHPCEFSFMLRKFTEPGLSCFLQPYRVCSPMRVFFHASQVHRAWSLVLLATLPGLLTHASFLSCFASSSSLLARASCNLAGSPSLLARASCNLTGSAHPCVFTFMLRKFVELARSCFLQPCRVCSPVQVFSHASQVRRACSLVLHATLLGLLTHASFLSCFARLPSLLARASCNLAGSAHPCEFTCASCNLTKSAHLCEFTFMLPKFDEPARSYFLQHRRVCSPMRVYFHASQVRRACWPVLLATMPGLLSRLCFLQTCRVCSLVRVYFHASQVRRACALVLLATMPDLLRRASLLSCFASSPNLVARASCNLAGSAHPFEFTFMLRKFAELARSCFLQPCPVCLAERVYFHASQVRRVYSLVLFPTLPGLLTRASLLSCFASSLSLLAPAHPCEFTFILPNFPEPARSCFLQLRTDCSTVRIYIHVSQVRRACSLVLLATLPGLLTRTSLLMLLVTLPGLLTRESLLSCSASSPSLLDRASCNLAGSAHPCEFIFMLPKFNERDISCFCQPCQVCSPMRVYFQASQVRQACSLVLLANSPGQLIRARLLSSFPSSPLLLATSPGLLTRASLLSGFASSPSLLARASCNLARSAHSCEFTLLLRKFAEPARSCFLQSCRVCSPERVYFQASQVRRATSLVPLATLPGQLTCASFLSCFASSPSLVARASCNLAGSAHPSEFTFRLRKFAEPPRSCLLQPCRVSSPARVFFHALQARRAWSLVLLAILPGLLTRASLLSGFASSPSHLARASCNLAGSAHLREFSFMLCKLAEPGRSCFLQSCRVCSPERVYFQASQVRRATSLVPLATLPGQLTCASFLSCFASSPSLVARASCNLAGSAHPSEFTFRLRKFAEPPRSCLLQPCRVSSPARVFFHALQARRAWSLVLLAILPGLLTRASLLSGFASSPSHLARASCNLAGSAHLREFSFMLCKLAEPGRSCFLQSCRVCSPERVYFQASQVRRATSLVPLATLPGQLTCASFLSCFASSPSLVARASCNLAGSAHPSEFTFRLRKFAEPPRSCLLQPCRVSSPARVFFHALQARRAWSLVLLAILPGLLTRASLLSGFASSPSHLARASCNLAGSAHLREFSFMLCKLAEPGRSCFLQSCRVCSPERVYFQASQVRRATSLVPLATLPGQLTCASFLSCFASSPSLVARASCNLAGSAHPSEFTFRLRKFAEPPRSCLLQPCRVSSPARVFFHALQARRAWSLVLLAILPGLLTRASLVVLLPTLPGLLTRANLLCCFLCFFQPCRVCSPERVYFQASQVRRCFSPVLLGTLPGLLTRESLLSCSASSPSLVAHASGNLAGLLTRASLFLCFPSSQSLLAPASCNLARSADPCEFTLRLRKFTEPARYSPSMVARASCNLAGCAHPCEFTVRLRKLAELARSFFLQPCRSSSLVVRASCNLAGSAHPCEFTFMLCKLAEPGRSCFLQPRRVCSSVRVYFHSSQVRRACSLVLLATLPGLLTRASILSYFSSSPSLLARASCNLARSAHPCEFAFILPNFPEPTRSCFLQPRTDCSTVRIYFHASQVRRACSLLLLATSSGLLTRESILSGFASSPSLLAHASCNLAGSAQPCEFTFMFRKFAELGSSCFWQPCGAAHSCEFTLMLRKFADASRRCFLEPCRVCSPVRVYYHVSQVRRAFTLMLLATLPGLLTRPSLFSFFPSSPSLLARASFNLARTVQPCEFTLMLLSTSPNLLTHASLLSCFASSPSLVARASCNLAGSAHPSEFTFRLRKLAELARSFFLQSCRSPSLLARSSCNLAGSAKPCEFTFIIRKYAEPARSCFFQPRPDCSTVRIYSHASFNLAEFAHPCEFTFMLCKLAEPGRSCFLQPRRVCSPERVYFQASQARRACSLVLLAILPVLLSPRRAWSLVLLATSPGLLTRASLLSGFASSPSLLARSSCNLAGSAKPCEFTFIIRKYAEPARSCFFQPRPDCSTVRIYSHASFNLAEFAHPCEFTFMLCKLAEPGRSCFLQPRRVCSPERVYFQASQARRACSLVLLAILPVLLSPRRAWSLVLLATSPGLLTRASLLSGFASSPSLLARSSCNLAGSAKPCEFTFIIRKYAEPARSCFFQPRPDCSTVRIYSHASFNLAEFAHPCEFTFMLCKLAEPGRSCFLQPRRVCSPERVYFQASQARRACSLVLLAILPVLLSPRRAWSLVLLATSPGLLTRASLLSGFASSPSLLARSSCNLAGSAKPCEFTFIIRKYAEPARSCFFQPRPDCSTVRIYSHASFNLAEFAHPCEFTFMLCKLAEPGRSCFLQPRRVCSPERVYFQASQARRACSLVLLAILPASQVRRTCSLVLLAILLVLLSRANLLLYFESSSSRLARASCNIAVSFHPCEFSCASSNLAGSAHSCEFTLMLRKFADASRRCFLEPCQASQVRRACSLILLATLPVQLSRANLLSYFESSPSLLARASFNLARTVQPCEFTLMLLSTSPNLLTHASLLSFFSTPGAYSFLLLATSHGLLNRANLLSCFLSSPSLLASGSCKLVGSAHPCEFTFRLRKFAELARSYFLQLYRFSSAASQVRRACSLVLLATLPVQLGRANLLSCFLSSPSLLASGSCKLVGSAHPCEFTFRLRKFAELARSYFLQLYRFSSAASQVRRACSLVLLATLPVQLGRANLLSCFLSSPSLLASGSCKLVGSAHPCEFTFRLRKFAELARSYFLQLYRFSSAASQVRRACSLVLLATLPVQLGRANLLSCFLSSPSLLASGSCKLVGSAHPCEFTFRLRKFAELARSYFLQLYRFSSAASQVRRACSLVLLATLPVQLGRANLLSCFLSSPSLLASGSCKLVGSAHPCEFTFRLRKFAELARSYFLQLYRFSSAASQVRRACSLVLLATLPVQLGRANLLSCFLSSPSLLASGSCKLVGSAHPCEFTFRLRKFAELARSYFLQLYRFSSAASQVRRACSLVLLATLPVQLGRANLLSCFLSSPSLLASGSCKLVGSAHPCEFTFRLRKFAELARSYFLQLYRFSSAASQVRRACSLVLLATLPVQLGRANLLSCFLSSPSLLASGSCKLVGSAHPCEFTFRLRKFAELARSYFLQLYRFSSAASQVRRACSLVLLATLPVQLGRANLLSCFLSSPSLLASGSCKLVGSAHPCEFTFMLCKLAEPGRSCFLQPRPVCSPVQVYFHASQVRRACSLALLVNSPGPLTRASLLSCFPSSRSLLAPASCNLARSAHPCEFTFMLPKFAEPARSHFFLLSCFLSSPSLLARTSCKLAGSAHPCQFTFMLCKLAEPGRSCFLQPRPVCSPLCFFQPCRVGSLVRVYFVVTSHGLLNRANLLSCFLSSPSLLARATCNLAGSAHPYEYTCVSCNLAESAYPSAHPCQFIFMLTKFNERAISCFCQPCQVCSLVRVYFHAPQVLRACSIVPLATLPGLLTLASLFSCLPSSMSVLSRASANLAKSAHSCEFTFMLRKFSEPARSCLLQPCQFIFMLTKFNERAISCFCQPCQVCSLVRVYFHAPQVLRACSIVPLATLPGLLTLASLFSCLPSSMSVLSRASANLAKSAHSCEFTFMLRKFSEPARSCLLQPCQFRRASLLSYFESSPSLLARASCNLAGSAYPCEFSCASSNHAGSAHSCELTLSLRKLVEPASLCFLQPCRISSDVRVYFHTSKVRRACSLVLLATLPGLLTRASLVVLLPTLPGQLTRASLLCCFVSYSSLLACASCNHTGSVQTCEFTFILYKLAEPGRSCFLQPRPVCSPTCEFTFMLCKLAEPGRSCFLRPRPVCSLVRVYFQASQVRRACSLILLATLPVQLSRANLLSYFESSSSQLARAFCNLAGSAHPCEFSCASSNLAGSAHSCEFTFRRRKFAELARSYFLQPYRFSSAVRIYFHTSKVLRASSLVLFAILPGLLTHASLVVLLPTLPGQLTRASLLSGVASSPSLLAHTSCNLTGSAQPCEFTFILRKFFEPARSCFLQSCRASQVRRACSLILLATLPVQLSRANLLSYFESSSSQLARAFCNLAGSAHPCEFSCASSNLAGSAHSCEFTFRRRKFAELARSYFLQPYRFSSAVRIYFHTSKVLRASSLVLFAILPGLLTHASLVVLLPTLPGQLTRASLLSGVASSPSLLAHTSCNLTGSAQPCEFTFILRKFFEPARSCFLQSCRASQVRRACSLILLATLPVQLSRANLLSYFESSSSQLARAFCNLAGSAHPCEFSCASSNLAGSAHSCEFTFRRRKFAELARSYFLQPYRFSSAVRIYFHTSKVLRASSLVLFAILPGLLTHASLVVLLPTLPGQLTRASLLSGVASSPSLLAHTSCNLTGSAQPCEFTFILRKFFEPARSCFLQSCRASQVRRACSLILLATLPVQLSRANLLSYFESSSSQLARAFCNLAGSAHPCEFSCASSNLAGSAHSCEFTFRRRKFAELARSYFLQPYRFSSAVRIYFHTSKVLRASSLVLFAILPGLLTHASLVVLLPTLPGQLTRASLLSGVASSPSLLAHTSCNLTGSAQPCEFTFILRKFFEPARSCFLQSCRASQVRRACSLILLATLPVQLSRANLLSYFESSSSPLARASCNIAGSAHPCEFSCASSNLAGSVHSCEFTLMLRKLVEPASLCFLHSCRICSDVRVYFHTLQARRAWSLVLLATSPGLLTRASLLSGFASSPSLLARASCNIAGSAHPCEFTLRLRKFAELAHSYFLQLYRFSSAVRIYFHTSKVLQAGSLVLLATLPCLFTRASLVVLLPALPGIASSPSLLAHTSCNLIGSAQPWEFTFILRKFIEPSRSCFLQHCRTCEFTFMLCKLAEPGRSCFLRPRPTCEFTFMLCKLAEPGRSCFLRPRPVCSLVRVYFDASRASLLSCFASSPSLVARASCDLARSAHSCEFTLMLRKLVEPASLCVLQPCRICSDVRVYFHALQARRAWSLVLLATSPACASCNHAGSVQTCEFTFMLCKLAEPGRSCFLRPRPVCSLVRVYFDASRASLLSCFASSPSLVARASCDLARSAHSCEFTLMLRKLVEPASLCVLQPCRICSDVRVYFHALQARRAWSLVLLATSPACASCNHAGSVQTCEFTFMLCKLAEPGRSCFLRPRPVCSLVRVYFDASRASLLSCFASSPSLVARASCDLARSAHSCEFTLMLRKLVEPASLCVLQPCRICSDVRVYFHALQARRAWSLVLLATSPACASCNHAGSVQTCEFTFMLCKLAEPGRSCFLRPRPVCSLVRVYFDASRASLLSCFASSPSLVARASCDLARSAHSCEFTLMLRKLVEPASLCVLQPCRICSDVRVYFHALQARRAWSLVLLATSPACASCNHAGSVQTCEFTFMLCKLAEPGRSCFLRPRPVCSLVRVYFDASSPSLVARASCDLARSAHSCEFTLMLRKLVEPASLCVLQPCRICSDVRVYFHALQARRAWSLVLLATSPACASCNHTGSVKTCEFTFMLCMLAEPGRSCFLQPRQVSQVRRACSLVLLATLPVQLSCANLLSYFESSSTLLARASCKLAVSAHPCEFSCASSNLAGSAHSCEFTLLLRKFVEPARLCFLQQCRICSDVRVYFHTSKVLRPCSLVLLVILPGLLTRASLVVLLPTLPGQLTHASLLCCFVSSSSLLDCASCNNAASVQTCEFTFILCKLGSPVRVSFQASQARRACSLVLLATLPVQLSCANLLSYFESSSTLLARASCNLAGSAHPCEFSCASSNLAGLRKLAELARSYFLQPYRFSSAVRIYFHTSKVLRPCSLVLLAILRVLLSRPNLLSSFESSSSLLARASCNLAGSAHPCEFSCASSNLAGSAQLCEFTLFTFMLCKLAELARSCFLQSCEFCSVVRIYFHPSKVLRARSLVLLAILRVLLSRPNLLSSFESSSSPLARASCNLASSAQSSEFTFILRKFFEPARSCFLQSCEFCSVVRIYFHPSKVLRARSLVLLAILRVLLSRPNLLSSFESSSSPLARASCNLASSAQSSEFTFILRKFFEPARSCFLQSCEFCSVVRIYFHPSKVLRARSLVLLAILRVLLSRPNLLSSFESSSSPLARASCNLASSAQSSEFTFILRKFFEPARSCFLQSCEFCSVVRIYFHPSKVLRARSLVLLAILRVLLSRPNLLSSFESSSSPLARASCNLASSAQSSEFTFILRKFFEPARSCFLQSCEFCSVVRIYFHPSKVLRARSLVLLAILRVLLSRPNLLSSFESSSSPLARASCNLASSAQSSEFTFILRKFFEPARSCFLQSCEFCSVVRIYFHPSKVLRARSLVLLAILRVLLSRPNLLSSFESSSSPLARASCNLASSAQSSEFTFILRKFFEPARSCFLQSCEFCSVVRIYFHPSKVLRARSLVLLAILRVLLSRPNLLSSFESSSSPLARASCNLASSAQSSEFTFILRKFFEPARSCFLQSCEFCSVVRIYFHPSKVLRARSLVLLAILRVLLSRPNLLSSFESSSSPLARASCNLAGSAHPCEFSCASSNLAGFAQLCEFTLLHRFASSPSLLARSSCNLAGSSKPCEFTFILRKFAEPARSCFLQPCRVYSPVRV